PARAAAIGRLNTGDAGERRRLAARADGVGPRCRGGQPRVNRRRAAARGTARRQTRIVAAAAPPRAGHVAEVARLVRRTHRELVEVELAEHARTGIPQLLADGALVLGHEAFEDVASRGGLHALGGE